MPRKDSESSSSSNEQSEDMESLSNDTVMNKYMVAAKITNSALLAVIAAVKEGANIATLCDVGDKHILENTSKVFTKEKDMKKGIAMPTCISVDNTICHFSPLKTENPGILINGNVVKIDLGVHIDGYSTFAAHTVVVGASETNKVSGKKADLIKATYDAMEIAVRSLRPGNSNHDVGQNIDKTASAYGVVPVEHMLSSQVLRNNAQHGKKIIQNWGDKSKIEVEKEDIEENEVYALDVIFSSGKGKPKESGARTTVYRRNEDVQYQLKMKASRAFYSECISKHGLMTFSLRSFDDETKAKMGVTECEKNGLLQPCPVLTEAAGEIVVQFKCTVFVTPTGLMKVAGLPLDYSILETTAELNDPALNKILRSGMKIKKTKTDPSTIASKSES